MTRRDALYQWGKYYRPQVIERYGRQDKAALRESWHAFTDMLLKKGSITEHQYETWGNPPGTN